MSAKKIRALNDALRTTMQGGKVLITQGVEALPHEVRQTLVQRVREFKDFTQDDDPYREHDFGKITLGDKDFFWKIDYYDKKTEMGSEDPSDPDKTTRVLTILLAEEY